MSAVSSSLRFAAVALFVFLSIDKSGAACTPAHQFKTIKPGVLTIATADYPPFDGVKDGQPIGMEGDILRRFAEQNCLKLEASISDISATVQYVRSGRSDIANAAFYRTKAREQAFGMSSPMFVDLMGVFSKEGYKSIKQLEGKKVGTVQGYLWVKELQDIFGDNLKLYPNPIAGGQDLEAGRIDALLDAYSVGVYAQKHGGFPGMKIVAGDPDPRVRSSVLPSQESMLYNKSNVELGAALNATIEGMHKNGELATIVKSYGLDPSMLDVGKPRIVDPD
jgi:polar amino acid transport system substrate-binding protein